MRKTIKNLIKKLFTKKPKVYCEDCKHIGQELINDTLCDNPKTFTFYDTSIKKNNLNKIYCWKQNHNNKCKYFKRKIK